jgi:hypothetical protein
MDHVDGGLDRASLDVAGSAAGGERDESFRRIAFGVLAGLIAGLVSLGVGEGVVNYYGSLLLPAIKKNPTPEEVRVWKESRFYSAVITYAAMGAILGLTMGSAGGLVRGSLPRTANAAIQGLMLGIIVAASLSSAVVAVFYKFYDPQSGDLLLPLICHGAIWSAVGACAGFAFGHGLGARGQRKLALFGGFLGGLAAAVIYEIVGAVAFPSSKCDLPISTSIASRSMAHLLVALLTAVGALMALQNVARSSQTLSER